LESALKNFRRIGGSYAFVFPSDTHNLMVYSPSGSVPSSIVARNILPKLEATQQTFQRTGVHRASHGSARWTHGLARGTHSILTSPRIALLSSNIWIEYSLAGPKRSTRSDCSCHSGAENSVRMCPPLAQHLAAGSGVSSTSKPQRKKGLTPR
jgi:hypothetical protein